MAGEITAAPATVAAEATIGRTIDPITDLITDLITDPITGPIIDPTIGHITAPITAHTGTTVRIMVPLSSQDTAG